MRSLMTATALAFAGMLATAVPGATPMRQPPSSSANPAHEFLGVWVAVNPPHALKTVDGKAPPFLDPKLANYATRTDKPEDGVQRCLPPGIPRIYTQPMGAFRIVGGSSRVAMTFELGHLYRQIYLGDANFEAPPAYLGKSSGRWEGDTLVIDSTGFNDATFLDDAGMPHSDQLHIVERFSLVGGQLQDRLTIEDPKTFSRPWQTVIRFAKRNPPILAEDYCLRRKGLLQSTSAKP